MIKAERRILKELGFCVHIKHPHKVYILLPNLKNISSKNYFFSDHSYVFERSWFSQSPKTNAVLMELYE